MLYLAINETDRTADMQYQSLSGKYQLQQRADSIGFILFQGAKPSENQDVRLFLVDTIASAAGATITLNGYFQRNTDIFYAGQELYIRIGDADEEKRTVSSYNESTLTLILTAAPSGTVSAGDKIGILMFGGVVARVQDRNVEVLDNLEYDIECVDFGKIFDKKLVSDTWADVDSRYIINDFCNTTVNYNQTLDNLSYADNAAIQAEWIETGDGSNPTVDTSDYLEGTASGVFGWTNSGGTSTFTASPTAASVSALTGVSSGTPTKGALMIWAKPDDITKFSAIKLRVGSSASDYAEVTLPQPTVDDEWQYLTADLADGTVTGTPDWTAVDYIAIVITETASSSIKFNGFRLNADKSFKLKNVESTGTFDDLRSPQLRPTTLLQLMAKTWEFAWYIDFERDIHFFDKETIAAPIALTNTSANFDDLRLETDQSQVGNTIIVRGGERQSDSYYAEVKQGTNGEREWLLKTKFADLTVRIDNNTDTHAAEAGTTTTNIKITGHGLSAGDHVINRTRGNAVREVLTIVDPNNFTVEAVASQTSGDTVTFFGAAKTIGIEGLADEGTVDYVYNSNEKSVRAVSNTATLPDTSFIRFRYKERIPIQLQYSDGASIGALKALGFGDGVFDLDPITDRNIQDVGTAIAFAQAKVNEFSNAIITGDFRTDRHGFRAGQVVDITDTVRSLSSSFLIQTVSFHQVGGEYSDYLDYRISFGTSLFGVLEFYQKLLATKDLIELNVDEVVETYVTAEETVESDDVNDVATDGGFKTATGNETVESDDVNAIYKITTWYYEPTVSTPIDARYNLASYA